MVSEVASKAHQNLGGHRDTLPQRPIKSWGDIEMLFMACFFEDDLTIYMHMLLSIKQWHEDSLKDFVHMFWKLALWSHYIMTEKILVERCWHNLLTTILVHLGLLNVVSRGNSVSKASKKKSWSLGSRQKKIGLLDATDRPSRIKSNRTRKKPWMKRRNLQQAHNQLRMAHPLAAKTYSFEDDIVNPWFDLLKKSSKLKLQEIRCPNEVGKVRDSNYYKYHGNLRHPTKNYYSFKDIL